MAPLEQISNSFRVERWSKRADVECLNMIAQTHKVETCTKELFQYEPSAIKNQYAMYMK